MDEAEILGGQQVFARRVCLEDMIPVAVEELPLTLDGVVEVDAGVGGVVAGHLDLNDAGQSCAAVEGEGDAVLRGGKAQGRAHLCGGVLHADACDADGVAVGLHHEGLAAEAEGVQHLAGDDGHFALCEGHFIAFGSLDGLHDGVDEGLPAAVAAVVTAARAAAGCAAVDDDCHRGGRRAVGHDHGGRARAHSGDDALGAHRSHLGVVRLEGKGLGGRGGSHFSGDGAACARLQDDVTGVQVDGLTIHAAVDDLDGGRGGHIAAGGGDGGGAGGNAGDFAKVVDGGHSRIRGAEAHAGVIRCTGGQHAQRQGSGVADGDGVRSQRDVHLLDDHGVVQLGGDGVDAADAVRAGDDLRRADAHSLCHALRRHGHDGGVIGQESHRGGACGLGGQDDGRELLRRAHRHGGGVAAGLDALHLRSKPRQRDGSRGGRKGAGGSGRKRSAAGQQTQQSGAHGQHFRVQFHSFVPLWALVCAQRNRTPRASIAYSK